MEIEQLLQDEIKDELQGLSTLELGSDKYKVTTDGIVKLMDKAIEMDKINRDQDERQANRNEDLELKYRQIEAEIRDRKVKNVITVVISGVGTVVTIWGTLKTLKRSVRSPQWQVEISLIISSRESNIGTRR